MNTSGLDALHFDERGLIPSLVQDAETGSVLMLAYMNAESLKKTIESGETHFWSRSRGELWHKGETSGNIQKVVSISPDCDSDALLVRVRQTGIACHTGRYSCFSRSADEALEEGSSLGELMGSLGRIIQQRKRDMPEGSYTAKLLKGGIDKILKKIGEESGEVIIAAKNHEPKEIAWEVADLIYHTLVMLESEGVALGDVARELERRSPKPNA